MQHFRHVLIFFLFSLTYQLQAQLHIGFLGSGTQSKTTILFASDADYPILNQENLSALSLQIPIEYRFKKGFSLVTGPRFSQMVTSIIARVDDGILIKNNRLAYLGLPLQTKFRLELKHYTLYAAVGPYVQYNVRGSIENQNLGTREAIVFDEEEYSRFDFGTVSSLGWEKKIANDFKLQLQLDYQLGLYDIHKKDATDLFIESLSVGIGLLVPLAVNE